MRTNDVPKAVFKRPVFKNKTAFKRMVCKMSLLQKECCKNNIDVDIDAGIAPDLGIGILDISNACSF